MQFFAPTRVYLEKDCVANHKNELLSYGSRAFIITGKHSSKANGSLDDVLSILDEASVPYLIYNDIEENIVLRRILEDMMAQDTQRLRELLSQRCWLN